MTAVWRKTPTNDEWRTLLGRDDPVIIEVGCHDGSDTQGFLDTFSGCRIHCFEPDPRAIQQFKQNIHDDRVTLTEKAVTSFTSAVPWYASHGKVPCPCDVSPEALEDWNLSGSILIPTGHVGLPAWCSWKLEGDVQCTKLDNYPSNDIDLLWIDAQGSERQVFVGAKDTLKHTRFIYTEFYDQNFNHQGFDCPTLYEGQADLVQLICTLGPDWKLLGFYEGGNALFGNRRLT